MLKQKKLVEAALFMSPNPLPISALMEATDSTDYTQTKNLVLDFLKDFNSRDSVLEIVQVDDKFQMRVHPDYDRVASKFASQAIFHKGIMKTLALISFKQPITQSAVIKYRNNKAYDHIGKLMEEGMISKEAKGRTYVLRTTKKFLDYFGEQALKNPVKTE